MRMNYGGIPSPMTGSYSMLHDAHIETNIPLHITKKYPEMIQGILSETHADKAIEIILSELKHAEAKHPGWPDDIVHAVAIMIEEAGEAMQAAINCHYEGGDIELLRIELAQVGAMCVRTIMHLPAKQERMREPSPNISGWNIHQSEDGIYSAFKKIHGKMIIIPLGTSIDHAAQKIEAKEHSLKSKQELD